MIPRTGRDATVRLALVGAGAMGSLHARTIAASQQAELTQIIDPDERCGRALADRYGTTWAPAVDDLAAFDGVIVAAPTPTHDTWARRVIEAGVPVLVEKPITDDLQTTQAILELSAHRDVPIMCGFLERFNPAVMTAMGIIEEPVHVTAVRHSPYAPRIRTGVGYDLLIHDVDIVLRMAGEDPTAVRGSIGHVHPRSMHDAEDIAEVNLTFASGLLAALSTSRVTQRKVRTLTIVEIDRQVEVDLVREDITVYHHVGNELLEDGARGYRQQTVIDIPFVQRGKEPLAGQLEAFVALVRDECDADSERASLLAPHRVVDQARRVRAQRHPTLAPGGPLRVAVP